jgi:putative transposase
MNITQKFSVNITEEQEDVSWILSEKCRLLRNFSLHHREDVYKETGEWLTYTMQQDDLPALKVKYPEYGWVYSKTLEMVLVQLYADISSYKGKISKGDLTARPPGDKGKDYFTTMIWNQSGFKVEDGYINLSHYYNEGKKSYVQLKFKIPNSLMNSANIDLSVLYGFEKIKQITMFRDEKRRDKKGKFYLSVTYDYPNFPPRDNNLYQAIDLGIGKTVTAVNMEAKFFEIKNPRQDLYWNPIIDEIQSRRDHCKKTTEKFKDTIEYVDKGKKKEKEIEKKITEVSNRWIELNDNKIKCHKKCSDQIQDGQHKWSDKMVKNTRSNTIIVGELSVKEMAQSGVKIEVKKKNETTKEITKEIIKVKSKKLNRSTQNQGYISRFVRFLTYKAEKIGKRVIEISEKNTTKRCYACGKLHDMPLSKRIMKCDCGNVIDRDRNSAVNIMIDFLLKYNLMSSLRRFTKSLSREGLLVPTWVNI